MNLSKKDLEMITKKTFLFVFFLLFTMVAEAKDSVQNSGNLNSASLGMRPIHSMVNPAAMGFYNGSELSFESYTENNDIFGNENSLSYGFRLFPGLHLFARTSKIKASENNKISAISFIIWTVNIK